MRTLRRPVPRAVALAEPTVADFVEVRVIGRPAPQGSKRFFAGGGSRESSRFLDPWRDSVQRACELVMDDQNLTTITGPVRCECVFTLDGPPKSAPDRVHPTVAPDVDKLVRSTLDAIVFSELLKDDCLVVELGNTRKVYAGGNDPDRLVGSAGVVIRIWRL